MGDNVQKTPLATGLTKFTRKQIEDALQATGQKLPVTVLAVDGPFVQVNFDVQQAPITFPTPWVPQAISRYARPPTQAGDKGFVTAADAYLFGVTGQAAGNALYAETPGNLGALIFVPLSNTLWPDVDPNAYNITAPNGAVIKDDSGHSIITLTPTSITLAVGSSSIVITDSGVTIMGRDFLMHTHSGVTAGGDDTGGVV